MLAHLAVVPCLSRGEKSLNTVGSSLSLKMTISIDKLLGQAETVCQSWVGQFEVHWSSGFGVHNQLKFMRAGGRRMPLAAVCYHTWEVHIVQCIVQDRLQLPRARTAWHHHAQYTAAIQLHIEKCIQKCTH